MSVALDRIKHLLELAPGDRKAHKFRIFYHCCHTYGFVGEPHSCAQRQAYVEALEREFNQLRRCATEQRLDFQLTAPLGVAYHYAPKPAKRTLPL